MQFINKLRFIFAGKIVHTEKYLGFPYKSHAKRRFDRAPEMALAF